MSRTLPHPLGGDPPLTARLDGFQQEWQRESRLVTLARERERDRLRPLLGRCEAAIVDLSRGTPNLWTSLLADLRAELDRKKEK